MGIDLVPYLTKYFSWPFTIMTNPSDHLQCNLSLSSVDIPESAIVDPPPPYPDPHRRHRTHVRGSRAATVAGRTHTHLEAPSDRIARVSSFYEDDDEGEANENTPFLSSNRTRHARHGRQRSFSQGSTPSVAPSLAQTVLSFFQEDEDGVDCEYRGDCEDGQGRSPEDGVNLDEPEAAAGRSCCSCCCSRSAWVRYFRPLRKRVYYKALFHLYVLNFPYALAAWIYLFVFTVVSSRSIPFLVGHFWTTKYSPARLSSSRCL